MNESFLRDFFHLGPAKPERQRWEYKSCLTTGELILGELHVLGAEGWEFVALIPPGIVGEPGSRFQRQGAMIFKRPKP